MDLQKSPSEKKIKQHNTSTSGRYDFSSCQLDVLFMLLASLDESDEVGKEYYIRVKDIELITGRKWNYQQLKEGNEGMMSRVFRNRNATRFASNCFIYNCSILGWNG